MDNFFDTLSNIYRKEGYIQKYGFSLILTVIIVLAYLITIAYFRISNSFIPIRANWLAERCNPQYIPLAGFIQGKSGLDNLSYTAANFSGCTDSILRSIATNAINPISYVTTILTGLFSEVEEAISSMRGIFSRIRGSTMGISQDVMGRTLNTATPLIKMMAVTKDTMAKSTGVATAGLYTLLGSYMTLKSLIGAILELCIIILIALAALIIVMWIIPFTWPVAASMTTIFIAIAVPLAIIAVFMARILATRPQGSIPSTPSCFVGETMFRLRDGRSVKASDLKCGMRLEDGQHVTATIKVERGNEKLYTIGSTIVSGSHLVFDESQGWIEVANHSHSILVDRDDEYLYCISTSHKTIRLNDYLFCDWDDLTAKQSEIIKSKCQFVSGCARWDDSKIHQNLETGFAPDTLVMSRDGSTMPMGSVNIGDVLHGGHRVIGTVTIRSDDVQNVGRYYLGDTSIVCGPNVTIHGHTLGIIHTTDLQFDSQSVPQLVSLITDTHLIPIEGYVCSDYDSRLDDVLHVDKMEIVGVSKKYID